MVSIDISQVGFGYHETHKVLKRNERVDSFERRLAASFHPITDLRMRDRLRSGDRGLRETYRFI